MNKKRCAFVAAAVLAVCTVAFLCRNRPAVEAEGTVLSSVSASPAKVPAVASSSVTPGVVLQPSSNQTATVRGTKPYVLTSEKRFGTSLRLAAEALGARTIDLQSRHALLVEADAATCARLAADPRFTSVDEFLPADKVAPELAAALAAGAKSVEASIITLSPEDRQIVLDRIASRGGEVLTGCLNDGDTFSVRLPAELVADLAANGDVRWMEQFVRPQFLNDLAVEPKTMNIRSIWKSEEIPGGLSGAGQIVSTSDTGIDSGDLATLHEDLRDRVLGIKVYSGCNKTDSNGHGTHTAGSIVGNGKNSDGKIRGTAWGANLYAWFCCGADGYVYTPSSYDELFRGNTRGTEWNAHIHSASWGSSTAGQYSARCRSMDQWVWEHPDFLPVYSAGNDGRAGAGTIGDPAAAKNVLTVGATQNLRTGHDGGWGNGDPVKTAVFSSRGPCQDGRIKPDISAPGVGILSTRSHGVDYSYGNYDEFYAFDSGTSMSCPLTAGAVALVREWLVERRGFSDVKPTAALMKAVITGGAKGAAIPNNNQGWGRVDLAETLFPSNRAVKLVDRIPFADGEELTWIVETTNAAPLDVQLAWIDYPGAATGSQGASKLVNDLDLTVEPLKTGGGTLYGNGGTAPDELNNMESVHFAKAEPDKYLITVNCKSVLYDWTKGGAAALYVRGAFDPDYTPDDPEYVRNATTGKFYISLDKALGEVENGDTIEVLEPVALKKSVRIPVNCTITATNESALASLVTCREGAAFTVAAGARVLFTNIAFANADESPVTLTAESGGTIAVKGFVGINRVETSSATGFELAGRLDEAASFVVNCKGQDEINDIFGIATVSLAELGSCANQIIHPFDEDLGGEAVENSGVKLRWGLVPVPDSAAVVRLVQDDTSVNFRSMAKLVKSGYLTNDAALVVCKNCPFIDQLELPRGKRLLLMSDGSGTINFSAASTAGFVIPADSTLTVSNLTVSGQNGYNGDVLFRVDGGELVLAKGATLTGLTGTSRYYSGAICVDEGAVTMLSGSTISKCKSVYGGAITLSGEGCLADLKGGTITGCQASYGGGVYASWDSEVCVSGNVRVTGNTDSAKKANNIYLDDEDAIFTLAGRTSGKIGVQYGYPPDEPGEIGNVADSLFIAVGEGVSAADAAASCASFSCDLDPELMVTVAEDGQSLVWAEKPPYTGEVDPSEAAALVIYNDGQPGATTNFYVNFDWAIESLTNDATVVLCGTNTLSADLTIDRKVLVRSASSVRDEALYRTADAQLNVVSGGSLVLTNVLFTMIGFDDYLERNKGAVCTKSLITVSGGELVLQSGAVIDNCWCTFYGKAGGVTVTDNGRFRMERGAEISFCRNFYTTVKELDVVTAGGVMVCKGSSAEFAGGQVSSCSSLVVGGVYVDGESTVHVSGDSKIAENFDLDAVESNMIAGRGVVLDDVFTGSVRLSENIASVDYPEFSTNVFGSVAAGFTVALSDLAASAANFRRDADPKVRGCAVTNATKALLVWSTAVDEDGVYTDEDGNKYAVVDGVPEPPTEIDPPTAVMGLVYNGNEQTGVVEADGYTVTGNVAINAGDYTATVTLRAGYVWTGGSTDPLQIGWSIAKATYDMSGVTFDDAEFVEDGTPKSLAISGDLPDGVSVSYEGNGQSAPGSYTVTAKFAGDAANYEPIDDMTATLTITKKEDPEPDPQWTVVTNQPTPIAFKSIDRVTDTEWTLVITDRVEYCNYRLLWTTNLVEGFVSTGAWEHAVGPAAEPVWTTNVITTGGAWFWRAEGTEGTNMVPRVEE